MRCLMTRRLHRGVQRTFEGMLLRLAEKVPNFTMSLDGVAGRIQAEASLGKELCECGGHLVHALLEQCCRSLTAGDAEVVVL